MIKFEEFPDIYDESNTWGRIEIRNPEVKKEIIAIAHLPTINKKYDVADGFNDVFHLEHLDGFNSKGSNDHIFQAIRGRNTERTDYNKKYSKCFRSLNITTIIDNDKQYKVRVKWVKKDGNIFYGADGYIWVDLKYINLKCTSGEYFGNRIKAMNERISDIFKGIKVVDFCIYGDGRIKVHRPITNDYVLITVTKHTIDFLIVKYQSGYRKENVESLFYKDFYKKLVRMMDPEVKALNLLKIK